jgi:hypothetical protein
MEAEEAADGGRGGGRWAVGPRGEERGGGTREKEREVVLGRLLGSFLLFFFSFSFPHSNYSNNSI